MKKDNSTLNTEDEDMPLISGIIQASKNMRDVVIDTPLQKNILLSEKYGANIYLKREDMQVVRSFKIRGAYHKISSLSDEEKQRGVVCASAGNHSQGVAYSCAMLKVSAVIYMPTTTPAQKVKRTRMFGKDYVEVILIGKTFDDAYAEAVHYKAKHHATLVHPFDDA